MAPTLCSRCGDVVEEGCDLRDELAELDALLERLRLKRLDLKRKINRFHSHIVRQLPPDVTSTIFEFCLPDFADDQLFSSTTEDFFVPLTLGAVCSYWREIAWSTPSLWTSLMVVPSKFGRALYIPSGIAQEWLARSGQLPLSIRIIAYPIYRPVSALANIINRYSSRWSNLDFYMPQRYYRYFHATAPILKSIRFQCSDYNATNLDVLDLQLACPRLERANLSFPMGGTNIQWDNLTHLTLNSISIADSFLILRKTPQLVFCKASSFHSGYREPIIGAPLVLTSLRSLQLTIFDDDSFAEDFLNNLIAPHLEEFSLPKYFNPSMEAITSFFRRSACSLRSFSTIFSCFPPYFEGFMSLLQSMPSLSTLSVMSITTTREIGNIIPEDYDLRNVLQLVAKVLSSQSASLQQGFLPNLKILEYTGLLHLHPENYGDLYPLPPADNAVHGPLHLLKLDLYPATRIPENMISYLSSLVERGVTVDVFSESEDILQSSIDYYRWRKDSLCRDWIDNLDSIDFCEESQIEK